MNAWQEYKKRMGDTRPWDLLNPNVEKLSTEDAGVRMDICNVCPEIIPLTKQCKQCGCFMAAKTRLKEAKCPLNKW